MKLSDKIERLAQILHESGREAVEQKKIYRSDLPMKPFCEWVDLPEDAKEGRRMMAQYLQARPVEVSGLLDAMDDENDDDGPEEE